MKTLVVSGGGSWGAYTVGRMLVDKIDYDMAIGCSTGSLIAPFALLGKYDLLKDAYSSIDNNNIFNFNVFNKKGKFSIFKALYRIITGKKTLGEHLPLLDLIKKYYTIDIHNEILASKKELYITVCNITNQYKSTEYISPKDHDYDTFIKYIWASCSVPVVTSIVNINDNEYVDGGTTEGVPLLFAVLKGSEYIDVYLHEVEIKKDDKSSKICDIFHLFTRIINVLRREMRNDDLGAYYMDKYSTAKLNLKFMPKNLDKSPLYFNKQIMSLWIKEGEQYEFTIK